MDYLTYKGYTGSKVIDEESDVLHGKILFIDDLVTYEGERPSELKAAFEEAVDDYIATCKVIGKEPQRPYTGSFNVRVTPELHRAAAQRAVQDGIKLNRVVVSALESYLIEPRPLDAAVQTANVRETFQLGMTEKLPHSDVFRSVVARVTAEWPSESHLVFVSRRDWRASASTASLIQQGAFIEQTPEPKNVTAH